MPGKRSKQTRRDAMLAAGKAWIVHPREVAKCTAHYQTDPEILLACAFVGATNDTSQVLRAIVALAQGIQPADDDDIAWSIFAETFLRGPLSDFPADGQKVLELAAAIGRARRPPTKGPYRWSEIDPEILHASVAISAPDLTKNIEVPECTFTVRTTYDEDEVPM
jgi:hypothetical protein